jgi:ferrochelatase
MSGARIAVLFASFGGPETEAEILPFLEHVTRGRGIPRERLLGVAEHYRHIGGRSPINEITRAQAGALQEALAKAGDPRRVYIGQRHSAPFIGEALARMRDDGVQRALVFITAAYHSEASLERYVAAVADARAALGPGAPEVEFVGPWSDHPLFIDALVARAQESRAPAGAAWAFTAHSIPCAMAKDSVYVEELRRTAGLVAARCGVADWTLAFTSRSGNPRDAWLEPDISKVIASLAARGGRDLVTVPLGFVADHVEVLYDLDVEAKAAADAAGVRLHRVPTVGVHPSFVAMMAAVVGAGAPSEPALGVSSAATRFHDGSVVAKAGSGVCFCFPDDANAPCRRAPASGGRPSAAR